MSSDTAMYLSYLGYPRYFRNTGYPCYFRKQYRGLLAICMVIFAKAFRTNGSCKEMERREHDEIFNLTEGVDSFQVKNHFPGKFVSSYLAQSVLDESSRNRVQFPKKCIIVSI